MTLQDHRSMRDAFGQALLEEARLDDRIVAVSADVKESTRLHLLAGAFPDRYFEMGISEQHMMGAAAGMALEGLIPFTATYACFSPGRTWEQLRSSVCYQNANVKVIGAHIGFGPARDGATHQCFEDIAITRCLPNLVVIAPADSNQCAEVTKFATRHKGPVYIRMTREEEPIVTEKGKAFQLGKFDTLREGRDVTFIAIGRMVKSSLDIAEDLEGRFGLRVRVLNGASLKPIDRDSIIRATRETRAIVTFEEHQIIGGLGSAVAEVVCQAASAGGRSIPVKLLGMNDQFGHSGYYQDLYGRYGLDTPSLTRSTVDFLRHLKLC